MNAVASSLRPLLYYEVAGEGVPILLVHPSGATASTWGCVDELARVGQVISYDRRGYARSGGVPVRSVATHTADAAALLTDLGAPPAVVVGTSAGATIAIDLAVRHPELVKTVIAHEAPWRFTRRVPTTSQLAALASIGWRAMRHRHADAAAALLWSAYAYRDHGSAWDSFPEEWRQAGLDNARATLADFRNSIGSYPSARDLATIRVPVVCSYGARSPGRMFELTRVLATAIPTATVHCVEGAAHAVFFDATMSYVDLIAEAVRA
jgi:pimeloyl-ACP methyl ester carboxylesterase